MDVDAGLRIPLGFWVSVGLHAVPVRYVELLFRFRLGLGSRNGRLLTLVGRRHVWRAQHRLCASRLSRRCASAAAAPSVERQAVGADRSESKDRTAEPRASSARQDQDGDDRREVRPASDGTVFTSGIQSPDIHNVESRAGGDCRSEAGGRTGCLYAARLPWHPGWDRIRYREPWRAELPCGGAKFRFAEPQFFAA